ncbi:MAG: amidohydrolase [Candidatus Odinarchaeota archaeon]|nr:amidohydrolase [Candidatus Odinarchaeota archaeon]
MKETILLKDGIVVTMNPKMGILERGSIVISEGRIAYVGKDSDVAKKNWHPDITIELKNKAVIPGLINTHNHSFQTLLKDFLADIPFSIWMNKFIYPLLRCLNKDLMKLSTYLTIIEMLESGTATFVDVPRFHRDFSIADGIAEAIRDTGIRGIITWGIHDKGVPEDFITNSQELIKAFRNFRDRWDDIINKNIRVDIANPGFWHLSMEGMEKIYELKKKLGLVLHLNIANHKQLVDLFKLRHLMSEAEFYAEKGFLDDRTLAVHAVWLSRYDLQILKDYGVSISHNPISNMYLSFGTAPIVDMLEFGINICLGTDGLSSYTQNLFLVMKTALLLHRTHIFSSSINAETVFKMGTINGAKALKIDDITGSIEVGKMADLVILNLQHANTIPFRSMYAILVNEIESKNVDTVFVNGKIVVENGRITTIDRDKILEESKKAAYELWERCGFLKE